MGIEFKHAVYLSTRAGERNCQIMHPCVTKQ